MNGFSIKTWGIFCIALIVTLSLYNNCPAASITLHETSLKSFEKRIATANTEDWRFVFLGDNRGNDEKFKKALRKAAELNPLFILHGGDISERGTATELAHFLDTVHAVPDLPPLFIVRGNHETDANLYEKTIGPKNFILDSQRLGFRLVAVDNSDYILRKSELAYLAEKLDKSRPIRIVSAHIPPTTKRWSRHSFEKGKDELINLMTERKVKLGLFAHIHLFDKQDINGIPFIISGGAGASLVWLGYSGDAVYHIVVVEIKKGNVSYRVVQI